MKRLTLIIVTFLLLTACMETNTTDPKETYKYWSGSNPPEEVEVIKGQYWQSPHFTKEYIMYMRINTSNYWWSEFIIQNQLQIDNNSWTKPTDAPTWFNPNENSIRYSSGKSFDQGSRYFQDTLTGDFYLYEIQL